MKQIGIKKILSVANHEYIKYLCDKRNIVVISMFILIYDLIIKGFILLGTKMGNNIGSLEPFIALCGTSIASALLPLVYMLTISDYPKIDGNSRFYIIRIGRYNWLIGQLLFSIESALTFISASFIVTTIMGLSNSVIQNKWSVVVTQYYIKFPQEADSTANNLINNTLYNQVSPLQTTLYTISLYLLFFIVISLIFMMSFILSARKMGIYITSFIIMIGTVVSYTNLSGMWAFPISHVMVWKHFDAIFKKPIFPIGGSYCYFFVILGVLITAIFTLISKKNFDYLEY